MAEIVRKLNLERDYRTFLYFIDGNGSVCKKPKNGGDTEVLIENAVERNNSYLYFIDKEGNIARSPRGSRNGTTRAVVSKQTEDHPAKDGVVLQLHGVDVPAKDYEQLKRLAHTFFLNTPENIVEERAHLLAAQYAADVLKTWRTRMQNKPISTAPPLPECEHAEVGWRPLETEYQHDGTAEVWQSGTCKACGKEVILSYDPGDTQEQGG